MAVTGNFMKVTLSGTLFAAAQSWSSSFWLDMGSPTSAGGAQTFADSLGDSAYTSNLQTVLKTMMISTCNLTRITYRVYQPDSKTLFDEGFRNYTDNGTGSGGQAAQTALVATLVTAGFGRAFRGRMYLPATGCVIGTGSTTVTPSASGVATAVKNYLQAWKTGGFPPTLISERRSAQSHITKVRVGQVFDTQRRRRDKLGEGVPATVALT